MSKVTFETVDVGTSLALIMAVKDDSEINIIKKACQASVIIASIQQPGVGVILGIQCLF